MFNLDRPTNLDAVLGSQNLVAPGSLVLGGIEAVKTRSNSDRLQVKILALKDAMMYGEAGLRLVMEYLDDRNPQLVDLAYSLLESRPEPFVKKRIERYLDDRELENQSIKYAWLESVPAASARKPSKKHKDSKPIDNAKLHSRAKNVISKKNWNSAS
jgi:hypothetical protein